MSMPNREAASHEAYKAGARWDGMEWVYPSHSKTKKRKMAQKMSSIDKLKKLVRESENLRRFPGSIREHLNNGNLPPGYHDRDNE